MSCCRCRGSPRRCRSASTRSARRSSKKKRKEGVLTTTIQSYNNRIEGLQGEIRRTQNAARTRADELDAAEGRAARGARPARGGARPARAAARAELATARQALAARLVEIYKADEPDALTVVLEADGFADLLERTEFLERISDQDREITDAGARAEGDRPRRPRRQLAEPGAAASSGRGAHPARARRDRLGSGPARVVAQRSCAPRATTAAACSPRSAEPRRASRGTCAALEAEQARVASSAARARAATPSRARSGRAAAS